MANQRNACSIWIEIWQTARLRIKRKELAQQAEQVEELVPAMCFEKTDQ
jgi:hypothetical protein